LHQLACLCLFSSLPARDSSLARRSACNAAIVLPQLPLTLSLLLPLLCSDLLLLGSSFVDLILP